MIIEGVCAQKQNPMPLPCFAANSLANGRASLATWRHPFGVAFQYPPCYPFYTPLKKHWGWNSNFKKNWMFVLSCFDPANIVEVFSVVSPLGRKMQRNAHLCRFFQSSHLTLLRSFCWQTTIHFDVWMSDSWQCLRVRQLDSCVGEPNMSIWFQPFRVVVAAIYVILQRDHLEI